MRKIKMHLLMIALLIFIGASMCAQAQQVKNVILMIPDGCSLATISTARWYQWMKDADKEHLNIDPYISGTVRTTCSNAPIGDSAPTTSTYMTGYNSLKGWVSTYPTADPENDIYPVDPKKAYQPLTTVLEAAKLMGKSTGLVCTCYFPHATPADCSAHSYNRDAYDQIATQQAHNLINVVIGGGTSRLLPEGEAYLKNKGWSVIKDNLQEMRSCENKNMWALFHSGDMPYDIDRDPNRDPSLAEMTKTAISKLSQNEKGFFLMVEGSKVDYAAHNNDIISMVTDFLAFDEACGEALKFAEENKNTAVIILSDHGNSGLSIGRRDNGNYAGTPKKALFGNLFNFKGSADAIANRLNSVDNSQAQSVFKEMCGFELKPEELEFLNNCSEYQKSPVPKEQRKQVSGSLYSTGLSRTIAQFMVARTGLAFTTNGHTGEDVILASYHPNALKRPMGELTNIEINHYLCSLLGITHDQLDELTSTFFVPHTDVVDAAQCKVEKVTLTAPQPKGQQGGAPGGFPGGGFPGGFGGFGGPRQQPTQVMQLTIKTKTADMILTQSSNIVKIISTKGKMKQENQIDLRTVVVYVDKNNTFYIPRDILSLVPEK